MEENKIISPFEKEKELGDKSTSVFSQNNNQSTKDLYETKTYQQINGTQTSDSVPSSESDK